MSQNPTFILYAIDDEMLCPKLGVKFETDNLVQLRQLLGVNGLIDPELWWNYTLNQDSMRDLCAAFRISFESDAKIFTLHRHNLRQYSVPYLLHNGYELPLLLQGRKKLAFMHYDTAYPKSLELKSRFDLYVSDGLLHEEGEFWEVKGDVSRRSGRFYYTPKGEEWRVRALQLVHQSSRHCGGWSDIHLRLEGMLMGYSDWENDWFLNECLSNGNPSLGMSVCCLLDKEELLFVKNSGLKALPWSGETQLIFFPNVHSEDESFETLVNRSEKAAIVRCWINRNEFMRIIEDPENQSGEWRMTRNQVPEFNAIMKRKMFIVFELEENLK